MPDKPESKVIDFDLVRFNRFCVDLLSRYAAIPEKAFGAPESTSKSAAESLIRDMRHKARKTKHSSEGENED
jgi:hypothetical protein